MFYIILYGVWYIRFLDTNIFCCSITRRNPVTSETLTFVTTSVDEMTHKDASD